LKPLAANRAAAAAMMLAWRSCPADRSNLDDGGAFMDGLVSE